MSYTHTTVVDMPCELKDKNEIPSAPLKHNLLTAKN